APHGRGTLGRGTAAGVGPGAVVAPVGDQRRVEGVAVALHGVGGGEEMSTRANLGHRLDADLVGGGEYRLEQLGEHLQHFDVEDELLVGRGQPALEPAGRVQDEVTA